MNALTASKAALTFGWLLAAAAFIGAGNAATAPREPGAMGSAPASSPAAAAHPKIGKEECTTCHGDVTAKANIHAAAADCTQCHEYSETPGTEEGKIKLAAEGNALCFTCHTDIQEKLAGKKIVHEPAQGDCTACHDPHSSDNAGLLRDKQQDLCEACHTDVQEQIAGAKWVHAAIKDHGCTACHDPHAADVAPMLVADVETVCLSCHRWEDKPNPTNKTKKRILDTSDGRGHPIVGHPYRGVPDPSAPGQMITCLSCHKPHAGDTPPRLRDGKIKSDFCSRCH